MTEGKQTRKTPTTRTAQQSQKVKNSIAPPLRRLDRRMAVRQIIGDPLRYLIVTGLAGTKNDVLAATGADCATVFAMGGAMGGAVPMGLGLALAQPQRRVLVVTGDGELLMNVGALATVAVLNPPNLGIVCVDNEHYGETGFQKSHTARGVNLAMMAEGAGLSTVRTVTEAAQLDDVAQLLWASRCSVFVLLKVAADYPQGVQATWDAALVKNRFCTALSGKEG